MVFRPFIPVSTCVAQNPIKKKMKTKMKKAALARVILQRAEIAIQSLETLNMQMYPLSMQITY